ncbi:MAG: radical SAM protein, partial [Myxococcales bacterium]|nr:radical SAM protein [Myxococcales bacterium]
ACDHACGHCYNVWGASDGDAQAGYKPTQLRGQAYVAMMEKAIGESGAEHITITGGEPLLHKDAALILETAARLVPSVQLITNGSHVTPEVAALLARLKVRSVQLTLLSADRARHDELKGAVCFDDTVRAIVELQSAGVPVQVCFVAMEQNWRDFEGVLELCFALGVRGLSYNRMSPTGDAIHHIERLLPSVESVEANLESAQRLGPKYGIRVATAMPIPPCLIRLERYPHVQFGFCSVGTASPNLTVDPAGNVRSCNLSTGILGNVTTQHWSSFYPAPYVEAFKRAVPEVCKGCAYERSCQGGCKESAFATFGSLAAMEPFLRLGLDPTARESMVAKVAQVPLTALSLSRTRAA